MTDSELELCLSGPDAEQLAAELSDLGAALLEQAEYDQDEGVNPLNYLTSRRLGFWPCGRAFSVLGA